MENGPVVYDFLNSIGIRTTKTVWMFNGETREDNRNIIGDTCENQEYLSWTQSLQKQGFEIALHNVSWSNSKRERIIDGLELFKKYFGHDPKILIQHNDTVENESLYWGRNRLTFPINIFFDTLTLLKQKPASSRIYKGTDRSSPFFWGDVCEEKIKYVRNFIFPGINTLKACPQMPYHDPSKPFVNKWFASTEAPEINSFNNIVNKKNIDRLEKESGCCIIYTHFGKNFVKEKLLNNDFAANMRYLAGKNGWFATASEILDHLENFTKTKNIARYSRFILETKWLLHKIKVGGTS